MKKTMKTWAAVLLLIGIIGTMLAGCGIGAPTVNLNDYVTVTGSGYDGYGSIYASVDYTRLIEDYSDRLADNLDTKYFGNQTAEMAAKFVFSNYDPYALAYDAPNNLRNGDTVDFSWNTSASGIEMLKKVLDVNIQYENFTYTVNDLETLQQIDPFENVEVEYLGFSGRGYVASFWPACAHVEINGEQRDFDVIVEDKNNLSNGDTIHVSLDEDDEYLASNYGIVLTRKEADITVDRLNYYVCEAPEEIFAYLTEESMDNAMTAITENYEGYAGDIEIEYVGALYYYTDEIDFDATASNANNQLALIYHVTNGIFPGGWYTYLAPYDDVYIGYQEQEDGTEVKMTMREGNRVLDDAASSYRLEYVTSSWTVWDFPQQFEYDGLKYAGHTTLEECLEAFSYNVITHCKGALFGNIIEKNYNHLAVTDSLREYITEW